VKKIVIALGGNAISMGIRRARQGTNENVKQLRPYRQIIQRGYQVVINPRNGPQVGNLLIHRKKAARRFPLSP